MYFGNGTLINPKGDIYEGDFIDGELNGMGSLKEMNGMKYIGMFQNGLFQGIVRIMNKHLGSINSTRWKYI